MKFKDVPFLRRTRIAAWLSLVALVGSISWGLLGLYYQWAISLICITAAVTYCLWLFLFLVWIIRCEEDYLPREYRK